MQCWLQARDMLLDLGLVFGEAGVIVLSEINSEFSSLTIFITISLQQINDKSQV